MNENQLSDFTCFFSHASDNELILEKRKNIQVLSNLKLLRRKHRENFNICGQTIWALRKEWNPTSLIESADKYGIDFFYVEYKDIFLETIKAAIIAYMDDVKAGHYYGDYDIGHLLNQNTRYNGCYEELDIEPVVDIVCDWIKEDVEQEVSEMIGKLPKDILDRIKISKNDVNIVRSDVERYIESYLEPSELEYDHHERDSDYGIAGEMDVLDCIFK